METETQPPWSLTKLFWIDPYCYVYSFFYDASNKPAIVDTNCTKYGYVQNLQGDTCQIIDANGIVVVEYTYDAWGKDCVGLLRKILFESIIGHARVGLKRTVHSIFTGSDRKQMQTVLCSGLIGVRFYGNQLMNHATPAVRLSVRYDYYRRREWSVNMFWIYENSLKHIMLDQSAKNAGKEYAFS